MFFFFFTERLKLAGFITFCDTSKTTFLMSSQKQGCVQRVMTSFLPLGDQEIHSLGTKKNFKYLGPNTS